MKLRLAIIFASAMSAIPGFSCSTRPDQVMGRGRPCKSRLVSSDFLLLLPQLIDLLLLLKLLKLLLMLELIELLPALRLVELFFLPELIELLFLSKLVLLLLELALV